MLNGVRNKKSPAITGIIVARTASRRLPGKVLAPVNGRPLIGYVIERAKRIPCLDALVLATTDRPDDDALCAYARRQKIAVYRGDHADVARRVLSCAEEYAADYFVRLNGDSPFLDPALIAHGMSFCRREEIDLVTNLTNRTFPYGVSVEIVRRKFFHEMYRLMDSLEDREHVTRFLYTCGYTYRARSLISPYPEYKNVRLVVDTESDLEVFKNLAARLGKNVFSAEYTQVSRLYLEMKRDHALSGKNREG